MLGRIFDTPLTTLKREAVIVVDDRGGYQVGHEHLRFVWPAESDGQAARRS